jgi:hypothetical protein
VNFGNCIPGQLAFVREFGETLQASSLPGRYPLRPLGSVSPTPAQLETTIYTTADYTPAEPAT